MELGLEAIVASCGARTSPPSCASARAERQRRLPDVYSVVMLKAQGHDATRESIALRGGGVGLCEAAEASAFC